MRAALGHASTPFQCEFFSAPFVAYPEVLIDLTLLCRVIGLGKQRSHGRDFEAHSFLLGREAELKKAQGPASIAHPLLDSSVGFTRKPQLPELQELL